jgi:hypothetical protein
MQAWEVLIDMKEIWELRRERCSLGTVVDQDHIWLVYSVVDRSLVIARRFLPKQSISYSFKYWIASVKSASQ